MTERKKYKSTPNSVANLKKRPKEKRRVEYVKCICKYEKCEDPHFEVLPSQIKDGRGKFCCPEHALAYQTENADPYKNWIPLNCHICTKEYKVKPYRKDSSKYCCQPCYRLGRRSDEIRICRNCNEPYPVIRASRGTDSAAGKYFCKRECYNEDISKRVAAGEWHGSNHRGIQGYYTSKVTRKKEYYHSRWERLRMMQLDDLGLNWTKDHGIIVPYYDEEGEPRYYVPDFLVKSFAKGYEEAWIEEVKPQRFIDIDPRVKLKAEACRWICVEKGWDYRFITSVELGIRIGQKIVFAEESVGIEIPGEYGNQQLGFDF